MESALSSGYDPVAGKWNDSLTGDLILLSRSDV
jgi:hypothetical protein